MIRPVTWAFGVAAAIAVASSWSGSRLAGMVDKPAGPPAEAGRPRSVPRPSLDASLAVNADLSGHFIVHPMVEGKRLRMLVDTGASLVALTHEDAAAAGIRADPSRMRRLSTANGIVQVPVVRILEMRLGDIRVRDVDAVVMPPGRLDTSLLGMSFLRGLRGFEIGQGRLILKG